jgi:hypothetical protein
MRRGGSAAPGMRGTGTQQQTSRFAPAKKAAAADYDDDYEIEFSDVDDDIVIEAEPQGRPKTSGRRRSHCRPVAAAIACLPASYPELGWILFQAQQWLLDCREVHAFGALPLMPAGKQQLFPSSDHTATQLPTLTAFLLCVSGCAHHRQAARRSQPPVLAARASSHEQWPRRASQHGPARHLWQRPDALRPRSRNGKGRAARAKKGDGAGL